MRWTEIICFHEFDIVSSDSRIGCGRLLLDPDELGDHIGECANKSSSGRSSERPHRSFASASVVPLNNDRLSHRSTVFFVPSRQARRFVFFSFCRVIGWEEIRVTHKPSIPKLIVQSWMRDLTYMIISVMNNVYIDRVNHIL